MSEMVAEDRSSPLIGTAYGLIAIALWSPAGLILSYLKSVPAMMLLSVSFSVCCLLILFKLFLNREWYHLRQHWLLWPIGVLGIWGNNVCYVVAIQYIPIEQVVLIGYLWPVYILYLARYCLGLRYTWHNVAGSLIAFTGIYLLITQGQGLHFVSLSQLPGYGFAFASGALWACYCVATQYFQQRRVEVVGLYGGIGAIISMVLFASSGEVYTPSQFEIAMIILLGLTAYGGAFLFWQAGLAQGNFKFLCTASNFIPVLATLLLIGFGFTQPTFYLAAAIVLVTTGAMLARR